MTTPSLTTPTPPFTRSRDDDPASVRDTEFLLASGHGGFAMGTALGVNRRKYHALLIAPAKPPASRIACLNALDDTLEVKGGRYAITRRTGAPGAQPAFARFEKSPTSATWTFTGSGITLVKQLRLAHRAGTCAVRYTISGLTRPGALLVAPLVTLRDFHHTLTRTEPARYAVQSYGSSIGIRKAGHSLSIRCSAGTFELAPGVEGPDHYDLEADRGYPADELLYRPGLFRIPLRPYTGNTFVIACALAPDEARLDLFDTDPRADRLASIRERAVETAPHLQPLAPLIDAADDFLVARTIDQEPLLTVLAGYPWFGDWGRDTMIALPGLMLTTKRFDDALACLRTFARYTDRGMIPNNFDDHDDTPHYNTVDASLWFIHAACEYLRASGDRASFDADLLPACRGIIDHYIKGTRYDIRMDPADALITAGDETTQLTWMDAKRDGVVFTPRHGKAIEINALWHHALRSLAEAAEQSDPSSANEWRTLAERTAESIRGRFWNHRDNMCFDCLRPDADGTEQPVAENRPNQLLAVSLRHSALTREQQRAVVAGARRDLLTPVGLRTLAPSDPNYQPRFEGDMMSRDRAYHNGTVWPWLLGPYAEALLRANDFSTDAKQEAADAIGGAIDELSRGCLGQIPEVYDADDTPDRPRREGGCVAQAWSVAEVLRIGALITDPRS